MHENNLIGILLWIVGVLVALAVGSGMIDGTLQIPLVHQLVTASAGWVVVVGSVISVILAVFKR